MKIVRAMKERSRLEGEIKELKHRIQNCISTVEGNEFIENFDELFESLNKCVSRLSWLKNAILTANINHDIYKHITQLGELKHYLVFLKELNPKQGKHERSYTENMETYISQITVLERNEAIQATQKEINRVTDILDKFNAETDIGEIEEIALSLPKVKKEKS